MVINVLSTPRTGSTWFSMMLTKSLRESDVDTTFLSEPFNPYHHKMYHQITPHGVLNHQNYIEGSFYKKLVLKDGLLMVEKIYAENAASRDQEFLEKLQVIRHANNTLVIHNHISPLDPNILNDLLQISEKNYMLIREDLWLQIASYMIAYHTKKFVSFAGQIEQSRFDTSIVNERILLDLVARIKTQRLIIDRKNFPFDLVKYEDIQFKDDEDLPKKQNLNAWDRLCSTDQKIVSKVVLDNLSPWLTSVKAARY